jgi:hypothetical protein
VKPHPLLYCLLEACHTESPIRQALGFGNPFGQQEQQLSALMQQLLLDCALPVVKNGRSRFPQGRTDLFHDRRSGKPLMLAERRFGSCKVIGRQFRIGKTTCLEPLQNKLGLKKNLSSLGATCSIGQPKKRKSIIFEASADGTDRTTGGVTESRDEKLD